MRPTLFAIGLLTAVAAWAKPSVEFLPADAALDPAIPSPEQVLGYEIGDWRITHDQLVTYLYAVANASDRVSINVVGRTHEQRPILQLIFTAPGNQANLEQLRQAHMAASRGRDSENAPLVVWLGQSIHGNESSGSNAAPLIAYYLAASQSDFVLQLLENSVILLDPSFNPDGMQRFSSWANANRSRNPVGDRNHRVHNEDWPQNRTNHYLFDLNRDWLPLVHPESRARVAQLHRWLPHVMTDQHEAWSALSYFFQPGAPTRQNPLLPPETLEMHRKLGAYHAKAMDQAGEPFYAEANFDDFYIGKGSTYTDINGVVGILFEQPRINGPQVETPYGPMLFVDGVANQFRTTLSTLRGAHELREELGRYQSGYFETMGDRARKADFAAWIIGDDGDPARGRALMDVFRQHQLEFSVLDENLEVDGHDYRAGSAWVVPLRQRQYALLQGMMERRTEFADETFYDVSAWTLPLAYNLPHAKLKRMPATREAGSATPAGKLPAAAVAWLVPWTQLQAPALLQELLEAGAFVQVATTPFTAVTTEGQREFAEGTLQVHVATQNQSRLPSITEVLSRAAANGMSAYSATQTLTPAGQDLGHRDFRFIKPIKPLLLSGPGTSAYNVGEVWHHMDLRIGLAPVMINIDQINRVRLTDYTHLVMTDASHSAIGKSQQAKIRDWVKQGGVLVAIGRATAVAEELCFTGKAASCREEDGTDDKKESEESTTLEEAQRAYADFDDDYVKQITGGAIVGATIDTTHPLGFGYPRDDLALFRRGATLLKASDNPYATPVRYMETPLLGGFMGPKRLQEIVSQPAVIAERQGDGLVIRFANNPLFRGFWRGTERLFDNSLYFGQIIRPTKIPD